MSNNFKKTNLILLIISAFILTISKFFQAISTILFVNVTKNDILLQNFYTDLISFVFLIPFIVYFITITLKTKINYELFTKKEISFKNAIIIFLLVFSSAFLVCALNGFELRIITEMGAIPIKSKQTLLFIGYFEELLELFVMLILTALLTTFIKEKFKITFPILFIITFIILGLIGLLIYPLNIALAFLYASISIGLILNLTKTNVKFTFILSALILIL